MIANEVFGVIYFPHSLLTYFLPPAYPISFQPGGVVEVDWLRLSGKLAVAFPASAMYGVIASIPWQIFKKKNEERA